MCGIGGIISWSTPSLEVERNIESMLDSLKHRGPDAKGIYFSPDKKAALCHSRLSIIDLSEAGNQPMVSQNKRYSICFNGEIYNYEELRETLRRENQIEFVTHTDTEVILNLYKIHREKCVDFLRGMFAFVVWDNEKKECFLARDPLGIKPLYYYQKNNTLIFASEVRSLLASSLVPRRLSSEGVQSFFLNGSVAEPFTIVDQVKMLPAGSWMKQNTSGQNIRSYWTLKFQNKIKNWGMAVEETRRQLLDSIEAHLVSDVPVGIFLSSGVDSTSVLSLWRQVTEKIPDSFTIGFDSQVHREDERNTAARVAEYFNSKNTQLNLTEALAGEYLQDFLRRVDQPTVDGFNTFCVSRLAADNGYKVVLSGLGGDEIFGGYPSFYRVPRMVKIAQYLEKINRIKKCFGTGIEYFFEDSKMKRIGDFLQAPATYTNAYSCYRSLYASRRCKELSQAYFDSLQEQNVNWNSQEQALSEITNPQNKISYLELSLYMRNQLLRDSDVMSMATGLELRVPFVDEKLISQIANIHPSLRFSSEKKLLVEAAQDIPSFILDQPKQGFSLPFSQWIKKESFIRQIGGNADDFRNTKFWYQPWALFILKDWIRRNLS